MKSTKFLWRTVGIAALISTLLFLFGFIYAVQDIINPKPSDLGLAPITTPIKDDLVSKDKVNIVALGDSLTKGTGDQSGDGGYAGKAKKKLEASLKKPVFVENLAVNGWRMDDLLKFLAGPSVPNSLQHADIIMLTIGANDINQAAADPLASPDPMATPSPTSQKQDLAINYDAIRKSLPESEAKLTQILTKIASINPKAKIVYVGLYNPYFDTDIDRKGSSILQEWNLKAASLANGFPNMIVVPTFDLFQFELAKYLYVDHFHPNQDGYERIADRVVQALQ
jgi:lysophospholipase L1-like esterase